MEPAHLANILFSVAGVDDAAGPEKQQGLETRVRDQVEERGHPSANPQGQHHKAQLADGGVSQHFLDIVLRHRDGGCKECGGRAHPGDRGLSRGNERVESGTARYQIDTGGNHGRGMDQRRNRRRAGHSVRQPDVQRQLC